MDVGDPGDARTQQIRRLIFVQSVCIGAIDQLDPDDLGELGLITRLQEIIDMVERDLVGLTDPG